MMVPRDGGPEQIDVTAALREDAVNPTGMLENLFEAGA